jgi:hypothetical protein
MKMVIDLRGMFGAKSGEEMATRPPLKPTAARSDIEFTLEGHPRREWQRAKEMKEGGMRDKKTGFGIILIFLLNIYSLLHKLINKYTVREVKLSLCVIN